MTKSNTPADKARAILAAAGYKRTQVSVKYNGYTVKVTIRDARVKLAKIRDLVAGLEKISRDESGEILCGGNTFLDIDYTQEALAPYVAQATAALAAVEMGKTARIGFHVAFVTKAGWDEEVRTLTQTEKGHTVLAHGRAFGIEQIVIDNLSRGAYV